MDDVAIIMEYTGWSREIASAAVKKWKARDPGWNAQYVLEYIRPGDWVFSRFVQPPNTTSSRPPEIAGLWASAESEPDAVNPAASDDYR